MSLMGHYLAADFIIYRLFRGWFLRRMVHTSITVCGLHPTSIGKYICTYILHM